MLDGVIFDVIFIVLGVREVVVAVVNGVEDAVTSGVIVGVFIGVVGVWEVVGVVVILDVILTFVVVINGASVREVLSGVYCGEVASKLLGVVVTGVVLEDRVVLRCATRSGP